MAMRCTRAVPRPLPPPRVRRVDHTNLPIGGPGDGVDAILDSLDPSMVVGSVVLFLAGDATIRAALCVNGSAPNGDPTSLIEIVRTSIDSSRDIRQIIVAVIQFDTSITETSLAFQTELDAWAAAAGAWKADGIDILDVLLLLDDGFVSSAESGAPPHPHSGPYRYGTRP